MAKKRRLGCSPPILFGGLVFLALVLISFLGGPLGSKLFGEVLPEWLVIHKPEVHLPPSQVFSLFGFPIANTVIAAWVTMAFLIVSSFLITRKLKPVPGRLQAFFEFMLVSLLKFCQSVAGEKNGRRFFPVVATIFLFVIFNAWLSLLPGFASITIGSHGKEVELLRAANTDLNMPLALAIVSFIFVEYFGLKQHGIPYLATFVNLGPLLAGLGQLFRGKLMAGLNGLLTGIIYLFVSILELVSHLVRLLSFTFRLFGVSTAGEILLVVGVFLGIRVLIEFFYGIELLFGFVQALIFSGLTLVFMTVAVAGHGEHAEAHGEK